MKSAKQLMPPTRILLLFLVMAIIIVYADLAGRVAHQSGKSFKIIDFAQRTLFGAPYGVLMGPDGFLDLDMFEAEEVDFFTDKPRNQSTVNLTANNWEVILLKYKLEKVGVTDAVWMPITGSGKTHSKGGFVYSAFLDIRFNPPIIRVLGVLPKNTTNVYCRHHFHHEHSSESSGNRSFLASWKNTSGLFPIRTVEAQLEPQWQQMVDLGFSFLAMFINCPLLWDSSQWQEGSKLRIPSSVSIYPDQESAKLNRAAGNNLRVISGMKENSDSASSREHQPKLTLCLRQLRGNFKDVVQLVENLELHSILGVTHFHLYGHTYSPQVDCILKNHYSKENSTFKVEFHNWEFPFISRTEVTEVGPETGMNDCLYRSLATGADFVANADLDEIFMPYQQIGKDALLDFLKFAIKSYPKAGAFEFSRIQFPRQYSDDESYTQPRKNNEIRDQVQLRVMRKTKVQTNVGLAPKLIVIPKRVVGLKTHWVHSLMPGYDQITVDQRLAKVHHYRLVDGLVFFGNSSDEFVLDNFVHVYRMLLTEKVEMFWKEVPEMCNITRELWDSDHP